ncbi:hypothetical protein SN10_26065 [Vibrio harveyi]|nr:hypothetical protein SN10_26065 [Vibrio harveyi]HDM8193647.1 hypothetical protein [Vibrio harveyi]
MKVKTYDSRTRKVTIEEDKVTVEFEQSSSVEVDFESEAKHVKKYPTTPEAHKKKWFPRPSLSDVLLGAVVSTALGLGFQYLFIGF